MSEERKKPGVAFWATIALAVTLVAYPLSIGPAIWLRVHVLPKSTWGAMDAFYRPIAICCEFIPGATTLAISYVCLWVDLGDLILDHVEPQPGPSRQSDEIES